MDFAKPYQTHNHHDCVNTALAAAKKLCAERRVRLTPLREQVLRLVWQSHRALGAYQLMDMLAQQQNRSVAPPTVYRALEFLQHQHFIHRIHSLNAFVGCPTPEHRHQHYFMICRNCQIIIECDTQLLADAIAQLAATAAFVLEHQSIELQGLCPQCTPQEVS